MKPIQINIVENWIVNDEYLYKNTKDKYIWNTNIPNPNYKPSLFTKFKNLIWVK